MARTYHLWPITYYLLPITSDLLSLFYWISTFAGVTLDFGQGMLEGRQQRLHVFLCTSDATRKVYNKCLTSDSHHGT